MVLLPSVLVIPNPVVVFPCGSESINRTRRSFAANEAARLMAVVVFPTPPFWFAIAITFAKVPRGTKLSRFHVEHFRKRRVFGLPKVTELARPTQRENCS